MAQRIFFFWGGGGGGNEVSISYMFFLSICSNVSLSVSTGKREKFDEAVSRGNYSYKAVSVFLIAIVTVRLFLC